MIRDMSNDLAIAARLERIEKKLDALLTALADEQYDEPKETKFGSLDGAPLDLQSDWGQLGL